MSNRDRPILPLYRTDDLFIAAQLLEDEWLESARQPEGEAPIESVGIEDSEETYY